MPKSSRELVLRGKDGHEVAVKRGPAPMDYVRPWLALPALAPTGFLAHWMWGDLGAGTGLAAAAIMAAGAVVTYAAHRLTEARTWYAHHIATATTGGGAAWLALATAVGAGRPMLDILIIGGGAAALIANVHLWAAGQGSSETKEKKQGRVLPSFDFAAAKAKIRHVTAKITSETEMQQRSELSLHEGTTVEDVQARRGELASIYGVAPGAVRISQNPSRADRAEMVVVKKDVMGQLIPWPGLNPDHVGTSIADHPLHMGTYEDGEPFLNQITNRHSLTVGMAGAGKSVYGKIKMVQVAARKDTFTLAIDLAKGRQTLGPIGGAIGWPAYTKADARKQLEGVKAAIKARANYLADAGYAQWVPGCGLTFLHLLVEEAAEVVDFDEIVEVARVARSTGIHLDLSLQRATWGNLDTDTRANLGDGLCFGVRDSADASFVLPDYVTDAGCDPSQWRKSKPGAVYAAIEYVDPDRHVVPAKAFGPPTTDPKDENTVLKAAADSLPDQDQKLDPITRKAFGQAYADYLASRGKTAASAAPAPAAPAPTPASAGAHDQEDDVDTDEDFDPIVLEGEDPDPEIAVSIDSPMDLPESAAGFQLSPPKRSKEGAAQARARLDAQIQLWADQGMDQPFSPIQLAQAMKDSQGCTRSRSWVRGELDRLETEGRVRQDEESGKWYVVAAALAGV